MKLTKAGKKSADVALITGIQKYLPNVTFLVAGQSTPAAGVVAVLQSRVDAANAVLAAEAAFHGAVKTSQTTDASTDAYVAGIRQTVLAMFAGQPVVLADFSVTPRKKPAPRTAEEKVVAVAKARATRLARGTMSAKKKAAITGNLTGAIVVPVDGSATSIASPTPPPATPPAAPATANGASTTPKA